MLIYRYSLFFLFLFSTFFGGCSNDEVHIVDESEERQYKQAKIYESQGLYEEALMSYLALIAIRKNSPESHLEAGNIYLNKLKDPIRSIYHFDRYLELKPNSNRYNLVKQLIDTAKKNFISQLPTNPFQSNISRIDLLEVIEKLKKENKYLKIKLSKILENTDSSQSLLDLNSDNNVNVGDSNSLDPLTVPRTYVVQEGDTLSKISKKVYGTASRWMEILQVNRDQISNENRVIEGQKLIIP